jgi:hypothetical protein
MQWRCRQTIVEDVVGATRLIGARLRSVSYAIAVCTRRLPRVAIHGRRTIGRMLGIMQGHRHATVRGKEKQRVYDVAMLTFRYDSVIGRRSRRWGQLRP